MSAFFYVFLGGGVGASFRLLFNLIFSEHFFFQNFVPNMLGCFLIGLLSQVSWMQSEAFRMLFVVGALGGLTTYSGYVFYMADLGLWHYKTGLYFFLSNVLGFVFLYLGQRVACL